jgi:hypothetical protein
MLYQVNCAQRKYNRELLIHVRSDHHVTAEMRIFQHLSLFSLYICYLTMRSDCCINYTEPFYSSFDSYYLCNNITRSLLFAVNEPRGQPPLIIGLAQYILTFPIKFHLRFVCFSP